jgi:hypothetical protein
VGYLPTSGLLTKVIQSLQSVGVDTTFWRELVIFRTIYLKKGGENSLKN